MSNMINTTALVENKKMSNLTWFGVGGCSKYYFQPSSEENLVSFLKEQGLEIYEPNLAAFRNHVQKMYLETDASKPWPAGVLDKINSLGN